MVAEARAWDREILRLALPAFGALVAEPLYVLTDTAIVGHLGTTRAPRTKQCRASGSRCCSA
jgi:Na+-driven multidrug efflux pump